MKTAAQRLAEATTHVEKRGLLQNFSCTVKIHSSSAHQQLARDAAVVKKRLSGDPPEHKEYTDELKRVKRAVTNDVLHNASRSLLQELGMSENLDDAVSTSYIAALCSSVSKMNCFVYAAHISREARIRCSRVTDKTACMSNDTAYHISCKHVHCRHRSLASWESSEMSSFYQVSIRQGC
jgi:hypothetical protein